MQAVLPLWLLFILVGTSQASEIIFTAGLPDLARDLNLQNKVAQLCSAFYFFGFTIGVFSFGRISDIFGRRKSLLVGISLYCIASLNICFVSNIYALIFCRLFQALGASSLSIISQAIARDSYHGRQLANIYSILSIIICFVPSASASIGGYIVEHFSWRYNVAFLLCIGIILLFTCLYFLPETTKHNQKDAKSSFFQITCKMLLDKKILLYAMMAGASIGTLISFILEFSVTFVHTLKMRPSSYGLLNIVVSISMLIGTLFNVYLNSKQYDIKKIMHCGVLLSFCAGIILLVTSQLVANFNLTRQTAIIMLIIPRTLQGIGHIILMPYILSNAVKEYKTTIGSASSIFNGTYYLIITAITFITSYIHNDGNITRFALLIFTITGINVLLFRKIRDYI
jgi:DHA1 family bicyclomycin/chloramphenicol resistance-like MFS transporter